MRNNLIKNVLIQFPCSSHTSFNMYRNSKCLHSWAIKLANNFWRLFCATTVATWKNGYVSSFID
jgi:hypothetical protein